MQWRSDSRRPGVFASMPFLLAGFLVLSGGTFPARAGMDDGHWDRQFALPGQTLRASAMRFNGNKLYLGGFSLDTGQVATNTSIGVYDGTNWSTIEGISGYVGLTLLYDFGFLGSDVYVGGIFNRAGGNTAVGLAKWNGSTWSDVSG